MSNQFEPWALAKKLLIALGFDFNDIYNDQGGIRRHQLKMLTKVNKLTGARDNAYQTINRLEKSKNKNNIDFDANLENTIVGTVSGSIMSGIDNLPESDKKNIIVKIIPSESENRRHTHQLLYGKVMPIEEARRRGIGVDYGCKCGMRVMSGGEIIEQQIKKIEESVK